MAWVHENESKGCWVYSDWFGLLGTHIQLPLQTFPRPRKFCSFKFAYFTWTHTPKSLGFLSRFFWNLPTKFKMVVFGYSFDNWFYCNNFFCEEPNFTPKFLAFPCCSILRAFLRNHFCSADTTYTNLFGVFLFCFNPSCLVVFQRFRNRKLAEPEVSVVVSDFSAVVIVESITDF